jgi:S-formylglutathione hydrolase FrmB
MKALLILAFLVAASGTMAQSLEDASPVQPLGVIGAPAGTGPFPAVAEARADAPGYTIYRPQIMPAEKLPLVLWGNGACRDNGLSASHFLREIASHGYVVVANGRPRKEQTVLQRIEPVETQAPMTPRERTPDETSLQQYLGAIAWAERADKTQGGDLANHIDTTRIAALGHSCGGLQALAAAADPRISAVIAFNSGVYNRPNTGLSGVHIVKDDLKKLHTPVAYFIGGPADIAFPNASDDVQQIKHVPVFMANLDVGHGGTFRLANGGDWARMGTAWLDWQLKKDVGAAQWFVGKDCGLCTVKAWTIVRKQFPVTP